MEIAIKVLTIIGTIWSVLQIHKFILIIGGCFKTRVFPETDKRFTYGICVSARNEANVIKNLLESVNNQDYDKDKLKVFIIAHNCTDNTADIIREYSQKMNGGLEINVFEYNNPNEKTKGYALKYLFNKIKENYGIECCDGYLIFDADNVLNKDYMSRMNEAFASGKKVVTSFRNSKNFFQNWISFQYGVHWMKTCLTENRAKSYMSKFSCRIQGTGFLFANEVVKNGWNYTSLTEDRAFCTDLVVQNYEISYCDAAVFYDEQPYKLKVALRQRLRWSKGHLQSSVENEPKLLKNLIKFDKNFLRSYDCFFLNFPATIETVCRKILMWCIQIMIGIAAGTAFGVIWGIIIAIISGWGTTMLKGMIEAIYTLIFYRKRIKDFNLFHCLTGILMFGTFSLIGKFTTYIALFKKVDWKPIPHDRVMDMEKLK